jgi:carboxyl-terminal processing protease
VNTREVNVVVGESLLRGPAGSKIKLGVIRGRQPDPIDYTVDREAKPSPAVAYKMLPDSIGYIRIASFRKNVSDEVAKGIEELKRQGASELVLDVRNSFGRVAEEGAHVAGLFVSGGLAARLQGRSGEKTDLVLDEGRVKYTGPLVERADLVGARTSGRSAVQKTIPMGDGSALVLSVSQYSTPDDKPLLGKGLEPSVEVREPSPNGMQVGDPILEKALELLAEQRAKAAA